MSRAILILTTVLAVFSGPGCTTQQVYGSAQGWQRNQCSKIPDKAEFDRCMDQASVTHDSYKRQSEFEERHTPRR